MNLGTRGVYIPSNADLDTYRTPGIYDCNSGSVATTLEHCPVTTGFRLIVETTGYGSMAYGFQTILLGSGTASSVGGRVYRRILDGPTPATSAWSEWKELPNRSEITALNNRFVSENKGLTAASNVTLNNVNHREAGSIVLYHFVITTTAAITKDTDLVTGFVIPALAANGGGFGFAFNNGDKSSRVLYITGTGSVRCTENIASDENLRCEVVYGK